MNSKITRFVGAIGVAKQTASTATSRCLLTKGEASGGCRGAAKRAARLVAKQPAAACGRRAAAKRRFVRCLTEWRRCRLTECARASVAAAAKDGLLSSVATAAKQSTAATACIAATRFSVVLYLKV